MDLITHLHYLVNYGKNDGNLENFLGNIMLQRRTQMMMRHTNYEVLLRKLEKTKAHVNLLSTMGQ